MKQKMKNKLAEMIVSIHDEIAENYKYKFASANFMVNFALKLFSKHL